MEIPRFSFKDIAAAAQRARAGEDVTIPPDEPEAPRTGIGRQPEIDRHGG